VKKSADSDSVSDSRRRHYKLIYTGRRAQRLSTGGRQMQRRCTSQAIVPGGRRRNATTGRHAVRPQQCRGHNHLGRSPERPGHIGQPAAKTCPAIVQKWVPYSQRYLFNAIPDTNHNANPNRYSKGNPNSTNPNTRYRCE